MWEFSGVSGLNGKKGRMKKRFVKRKNKLYTKNVKRQDYLISFNYLINFDKSSSSI